MLLSSSKVRQENNQHAAKVRAGENSQMTDASKTPANQEPKQYILSPEDEALLFGDMEPIPPGDPEEFAAAAAGIQRGLDDFAAGRFKSAKEVFAAKKSPFDVKGVKTNITREEIIEAIHEGRENDRW